MRILLTLFSLFGVLFCTILFALTFLSIPLIESSARELLVSKIVGVPSEDPVFDQKMRNFEDSLGNLKDQFSEEIQNFKAHLPESVQNEIALQLESVLPVKESETSNETSSLSLFLQADYLSALYDLVHNIRAVAGMHLVLFTLITVLLFSQPLKSASLAIPAGLLFLTGPVSFYLYYWRKDQLLTFLLESSISFGYRVYLTVVFAFLAEILFNKAVFTNWLLAHFISDPTEEN